MPHHLVGAVVLLEEFRERREVGDLPRGRRDVELWLPLVLGDDDDAGQILPQAGEDLLAVLPPPRPYRGSSAAVVSEKRVAERLFARNSTREPCPRI